MNEDKRRTREEKIEPEMEGGIEEDAEGMKEKMEKCLEKAHGLPCRHGGLSVMISERTS